MVRIRPRGRELGDFVRAHREKLSPAALGLPVAGRRRTPGLRREEVAQLCGLSVTLYTWLEQGREISVSPTALARLASALRLGRAERAYIFELAGQFDPDHGQGSSDQMSAAVVACVKAIDSPAYVLDGEWTAQCWNAKAEWLFPGWLDKPGDRNLLHFIFLTPAARSLICDYQERSRRVVAEFRADLSRRVDDPTVRFLVEDLRRKSPEFAQFWDEHWVLGREGGERTFNHPADGVLRFEQVTFHLAGRSDLKLTILVQAAGSPPELLDRAH